MSSSPTLAEKIARNPLRFGMIGGFLGVPLLWMAGDSLVRIARGQGALPIETFWSYEMRGALIGAFLGGQGARIWAKWRLRQTREARAIAFGSGALGIVLYVVLGTLPPSSHFPNYLQELIAFFVLLVKSRDLPFLLCLLLLFGGLLAPRK